jgi:mono/diheme cytochrome c family protein
MLTRHRDLLLTIMPFVMLASHAAMAQGTPAEIERGRQIAERLCVRCHAIAQEGESPHPDAPPFRTLHDRWPVEQLEEALAEGILVGHPDMPEFVLEPADISRLLAYLATLR